VQDFRVDERTRQRARRARLADASSVACHVPASSSKSAEFAEKLLESWDEILAMSRASFRRRLVVITRRSAAKAETARDPIEALSRASLGP
jgi:hypothetical protein